MTTPSIPDASGSRPLAPRTITTSRGALSYTRSGSGTPLILLHDLGESAASFAALEPLLAAQFQTCAFDLLGHGGSSLDSEDLSVPAQAEAVLSAMEEMRWNHAVLLGHGLGGAVVLRIAAMDPARVAKMVLISAGSLPESEGFVSKFLRFRAVWSLVGRFSSGVKRRSVLAAIGRNAEASLGTRKAWASLGRAWVQNTGLEVLSELDDLLEHYLDAPTLVLWGADDEVTPVANARALYRDKRSVRFVEISGTGHAPHRDAPAAVAELILDFLV